MNCENGFCIYCANDICILEKISIDSMGMCAECVYPDIDEKILKQAKEDLLKILEKRSE